MEWWRVKCSEKPLVFDGEHVQMSVYVNKSLECTESYVKSLCGLIIKKTPNVASAKMKKWVYGLLMKLVYWAVLWSMSDCFVESMKNTGKMPND